MKVFGSRYEHEPIPGKILKGIVLRLVFDVGYEGYADLHPWPEYGEAPLDQQLESLLHGKWSTTLQKTLWFAATDAKARRQNRNLLAGLDLPKTHGFDVVKIKMPPIKPLPKNVGLRIDFNGALTRAQFEEWWQKLSGEERGRIELIEDPYPTQESCQVPSHLLFSDWVVNSNWPGIIVKPAREFIVPTGQPIVFTHTLNHPIGQAGAIWEAARFFKNYPKLKRMCGFPLVESKVFAPFNQLWNRQDATLKPAPGAGFGFDAALRDLPWEKIL
jgi:O-succinylbenzoate synthase